MHTGPAVERGGDWFGATVNLAARLSAAAAGGEALLTTATKAAAGDVEDVELRERGRWALRNVGEPVQVYAAVRQGARSSAGLPIDPVCRMAVDPRHSPGRLSHQGVEYCFCSLGALAPSPSTPPGIPIANRPTVAGRRRQQPADPMQGLAWTSTKAPLPLYLTRTTRCRYSSSLDPPLVVPDRHASSSFWITTSATNPGSRKIIKWSVSSIRTSK
jgi:hypothetical protein